MAADTHCTATRDGYHMVDRWVQQRPELSHAALVEQRCLRQILEDTPAAEQPARSR
ncbi:MAG TPA: hypothetical protein VGA62_03240 [Acidimicrobiia bacterium]